MPSSDERHYKQVRNAVLILRSLLKGRLDASEEDRQALEAALHVLEQRETSVAASLGMKPRQPRFPKM